MVLNVVEEIDGDLTIFERSLNTNTVLRMRTDYSSSNVRTLFVMLRGLSQFGMK